MWLLVIVLINTDGTPQQLSLEHAFYSKEICQAAAEKLGGAYRCLNGDELRWAVRDAD